MSKESRTAKLRLLYIEYIYIVKEFAVAEKTWNWYLHLQGLMKMIKQYAKCSRLYLQEMLSLPDANTWLNKQFEDGIMLYDVQTDFRQDFGPTSL